MLTTPSFVKGIACYRCNYLLLEISLQGKTVEVGRAHFETESSRFTILDAPVSEFCFQNKTLYLFFCWSNLHHTTEWEKYERG